MQSTKKSEILGKIPRKKITRGQSPTLISTNHLRPVGGELNPPSLKRTFGGHVYHCFSAHRNSDARRLEAHPNLLEACFVEPFLPEFRKVSQP